MDCPLILRQLNDERLFVVYRSFGAPETDTSQRVRPPALESPRQEGARPRLPVDNRSVCLFRWELSLQRFAEIQREMELRLKRWMAETGDPFETGRREPKRGMLDMNFTLQPQWLTADT